jgi:AraC-like DNA-binding protein
MINNTYFGGLLAGPIVMSTPYHQIHLYNMAETTQMEMYSKLEEFLKIIPVVDPIRTNYLGNLLYLVATTQSNIIHYEIQEKAQLQSKINEQIQTYKENALESIDIRAREKILYIKVKQGDYQEARVVLGEFLALIYLMEGRNLEVIKARCNELNSLISRASLDGGAPTKDIFVFNMLLTKELNNLKSVEEVSVWMSNTLKYYCESTILLLDDNIGEVIRKAIQFICAHYKDTIKLSDVAAIIHLNASYFSSLFKKEVGVTFIDFLLDLRIEESKNLLVNTSNSILDIAVSLGFTSQSYFAKAFKKKTGKTPKKYRYKHGS